MNSLPHNSIQLLNFAGQVSELLLAHLGLDMGKLREFGME